MEFRLTDKLYKRQQTLHGRLANYLLQLIKALVLCATCVASADTGNTDDTATPACTVPTAGAPSCNSENAPGSSSTPANTSFHVGNPINVITGNKYQREVDFKAFSSSLSLFRHYNSSLSDYNSGMGYGWRHTFQITLTRTNNNALQIVQSDGRLISFHLIPGTTSPAVYRAVNIHDGILLNDHRSHWHLSDGRVMSFNGSRLSKMNSGDHRGSLQLSYHRNKLVSVTDSDENILSFLYVTAGDELPRYGTENSIQPVNALHTAVLPDGQRIRFTYDQQGNLITVAYPNGQEIHYSYRLQSWPSHLTDRSSVSGSTRQLPTATNSKPRQSNKHSQWQYDDNGLATHWIEQGTDTGLHITRTIKSDGQSRATVVYADDRAEHYRWSAHDNVFDNNHNESQSRLSVHCDNCSWNQAADPSELQNSVNAPHQQLTTAANTRSQLLAKDIWNNLTPQIGTRDITSRFNLADSITDVKITVDRNAKITNLEIGDRNLAEMARDFITGNVISCQASYLSSTTQPKLPDAAARTHNEQGHQHKESTCVEDYFDTLELAQELEALSNGESTTLQSRRRGTPGGSAPREPEIDPFCTMPSGKTCSDLRDDKEMAMLSRCAYGKSSCEPRWKYIQPSTIGLRDDQFNKDGFSASLYHDEADDRYVLAFRGTDGLNMKDWGVNISQGFGGDDHSQYGQAHRLAGLVNRATQGTNLEFTGHSLGGGLATIASLRTQNNTTVFNAASLHPETAEYYGLSREYSYASGTVNNVTTTSDPLTAGQRLSSTGIVEAPGLMTKIPDPYKEWIKARGLEPNALSYHSIDAVIESISTLLEKHCGHQ